MNRTAGWVQQLYTVVVCLVAILLGQVSFAKEVVVLDEFLGKGFYTFDLSVGSDLISVELAAIPGSARGRDRVSVAALWINEDIELRPRDFNQNVDSVRRQLASNRFAVGKNTVKVNISGNPDAKMKIKLVAKYPDTSPPVPQYWVDWYRDFDFDGYGIVVAIRLPHGIQPPPAPPAPPLYQWVTQGRDCNDHDSEVFPGTVCP
ncbi:MAG: hypothetical protein P1P84_16870 [Deferrisomatales bacterium]|nr:hypothetical protein [Deferrisomatales bacterium]